MQRLYASIALTLILTTLSTAVQAQAFPAKPVRLIVPQAPGGASDALARIIAQKLTERWGQPVVVENRAGAGGNIGNDAVAKSPADGYTLLLGYTGTNAINASLYKKLSYNPHTDFAPVAPLAVLPWVIVVYSGVQAKSLGELVALAKAQPGKLTYGSAGSGSVNHLLGEMLNKAAQIQITHVPYKGAAAALTDTMAGRVDVFNASLPSVLQHIRSGAVRPLVVTGSTRAPTLKDVPTVAEAGYAQLEMSPWFGLFAPAGTPEAIVRKINADVNDILKTKDAAERFESQGAVPYPLTPEEFDAVVKSDIAKWAKVVKDVGATLD